MPRAQTIHYVPADSTTRSPICGLEGGRWSITSTDPSKCTCRGCMRSTLFKDRHPELVQGEARSGRPEAEGVQKTVKFYLPSHLVEWYDSQPKKAGTVVKALGEMFDRENKKLRRKKD